ncbi:MAG: hypothetical protein ABEK59_13330 [Halobacteria archaeon]
MTSNLGRVLTGVLLLTAVSLVLTSSVSAQPAEGFSVGQSTPGENDNGVGASGVTNGPGLKEMLDEKSVNICIDQGGKESGESRKVTEKDCHDVVLKSGAIEPLNIESDSKSSVLLMNRSSFEEVSTSEDPRKTLKKLYGNGAVEIRDVGFINGVKLQLFDAGSRMNSNIQGIQKDLDNSRKMFYDLLNTTINTTNSVIKNIRE